MSADGPPEQPGPQQTVAASQHKLSDTLSAAHVWIPALAVRIAACLPPNDVPCTLRLVRNNKATAALFRGRANKAHTTVHLSQPCPPSEFYQRWGAPRSTRSLPLKRRRQLLCLTAASGVIPNLQVAIDAAGCLLTPEVFDAAAGGGHLSTCQWLLEQRRCPMDPASASRAAAAGGHESVTEWLIRDHGGSARLAALAVARRGHVRLMDWYGAALDPVRTDVRVLEVGGLLRASEAFVLVTAAAEGCGLAALQVLFPARLKQLRLRQRRDRRANDALPATSAGGARDNPGGNGENHNRGGGGNGGNGGAAASRHAAAGELHEALRKRLGLILAAAAASPTPDWRAKVEWLEAAGCPGALAGNAACKRAMELLPPDTDSDTEPNADEATARLAWLRRRVYSAQWGEVAVAAAREVNAAAVRYFLAEGLLCQRGPLLDAARAAALNCNLAALQAVHEHARCKDASSGRYRGGGAGDGGGDGVGGDGGGGGGGLPGLGMSWAEVVSRAVHGGGHMHVVAWAMEMEAAAAVASRGGNGSVGAGESGGGATAAARGGPLLKHAAESGRVEVVAWLAGKVCGSWSEEVFAAAAEGGCEEMLEWLAERGCAMGGRPYVRAAGNGDLATLRTLRRLGCPWGPRGEVFTACIANAAGIPASVQITVLSWLLEAGCPVDWGAALQAARAARPASREVVERLGREESETAGCSD